MPKGKKAAATFPLRFEHEATRNALRALADELGVSMNKLAQDAIAAQLGLTAVVLEARLERALAALREYRGAWTDEEITAFAHAEGAY